MTIPNDLGVVRGTRNRNVLAITVERAAKMNGFTPEVFEAWSDAVTQLDEDPV